MCNTDNYNVELSIEFITLFSIPPLYLLMHHLTSKQLNFQPKGDWNEPLLSE